MKSTCTRNLEHGCWFTEGVSPEGVCKGYLLGKHHKEPFKSSKVWQAQNLLELVHNVVCCINIPSLVGARYILTSIDDLSHFTWVYFLKNKNLVFEKLKEFRAFVQNKCGQPKVLEIKKLW
jgi:hypothetical protein